MTLTKNKMVSAIGQRTRLKNRDVQTMLEGLIEVWTEELVNGGRIELENFFVLEVQRIDRGENTGKLRSDGRSYQAPQIIRRLILRSSRSLREKLNQ